MLFHCLYRLTLHPSTHPSTPLPTQPPSHPPIHPSVDTYIDSTFWCCWVTLPWTWYTSIFWGLVFSSFEYIPRNGISGPSDNSFFKFFEEPPYHFPQRHHFTFPWTVHKCSYFFTSSLTPICFFSYLESGSHCMTHNGPKLLVLNSSPVSAS